MKFGNGKILGLLTVLSYTMKLCKRMVEPGLKLEESIKDNKFGLVS